MSEPQVPNDLLARLARVDHNLERLLAHQSLLQTRGLVEPQPSPEKKFTADIFVGDPEDAEIHPADSLPERPNNPLPFRVAVSELEADRIFQKVERINRDVAVMERVDRLERQNRKIVILGSLFMTLVVLMLGVSTFLMFQGNFFTRPRLNPNQPAAGEAVARIPEPQPAKPVAPIPDPKPAKPLVQENVPQPVAATVAPPAGTPAPGKTYVGSMTSNRYHYPDCKWAAQIRPRNMRHFANPQEARQRGYRPCPTCQPPRAD